MSVRTVAIHQDVQVSGLALTVQEIKETGNFLFSIDNSRSVMLSPQQVNTLRAALGVARERQIAAMRAEFRASASTEIVYCKSCEGECQR